MKISIDGGALCAKQYGNYIFTENLIRAICRFDPNNKYTFYSFCRNRIFKELESGNIESRILLPKFGWSKIRVGIEELLSPNDFYLAVNQSLPLFGPRKIISFSHGLSFIRYPQYYEDNYLKLKSQLLRMMARSNAVIVSSIKVKQELLSTFPKYRNIFVLPFGIPFDMDEGKKGKRQNYFLYVGMNHPIKNIDFIKRVFDIFTKEKGNCHFRLKIVSHSASRQELKNLYQKATACLTASHYESFNLPALEALSQNCPVIGLETAVIPELRKYVNVADSEKEFLHKMQTIAKDNDYNIDREKLRMEFSWKNYIDRLTEICCLPLS